MKSIAEISRIARLIQHRTAQLEKAELAYLVEDSQFNRNTIRQKRNALSNLAQELLNATAV